jgi:nucleotide-binding universal stress UspA family protein
MYQRILVPIDGSSAANRALTTAIELAQAFRGRVRLVHVLEEAAWLTGYDPHGGASGQLLQVMRDAGTKVLADALAVARAEGVEADSMLFDKFGERLGETVATAAKLWNADLVVVGTHGRSGVSRLLLGSGAEQILRLAPVPVLAVRDASEAGPPA